jgi:hypothetical protein
MPKLIEVRQSTFVLVPFDECCLRPGESRVVSACPPPGLVRPLKMHKIVVPEDIEKILYVKIDDHNRTSGAFVNAEFLRSLPLQSLLIPGALFSMEVKLPIATTTVAIEFSGMLLCQREEEVE